jgi:hypothetical protein
MITSLAAPVWPGPVSPHGRAWPGRSRRPALLSGGATGSFAVPLTFGFERRAPTLVPPADGYRPPSHLSGRLL